MINLRSAAVLSLVLASSAGALAQEGEAFDIDTLTCWDLGDAEAADRVSALMLVYGYVSGQRNRPSHSGADIQAAMERTGELCAANPDMYISEAMERSIR